VKETLEELAKENIKYHTAFQIPKFQQSRHGSRRPYTPISSAGDSDDSHISMYLHFEEEEEEEEEENYCGL
jgi:hypothetical protein